LLFLQQFLLGFGFLCGRFSFRRLLFAEPSLDRHQDRLDVAERYAKQHQRGVVYDVNEPAVILVQVGEAGLWGRGNVHKIDIAHAVINDAVDVGGKEKEDAKKLETAEIILYRQPQLLVGTDVQRHHHNGNVIEEILSGDDPHTVQRGLRGDQYSRNAAQQAAGEHEAEQKAFQPRTVCKGDHRHKQDLDRAKVKGQVSLGQDAAVFRFILNDIVKDLDCLGANTHIEHHAADALQPPFAREPKEPHDQKGRDRHKNEMLGTENRMVHKLVSL